MNQYLHLEVAGRLRLDIPTADDIPALFELHSDPRSWGHNPGRRHITLDRTVKLVTTSIERFERDGLSYWCVRDSTGGLVGWGGCSVPAPLPWWNLTYRIRPEVWGKGYATLVSKAAIAAANAVHPDVPVLAFLADHNAASKFVAERSGLLLALSGPDKGQPGASRLVYLDRHPSLETVTAITNEMFPAREFETLL